MRYESDHSHAHREYWRAILSEIRAETAGESQLNVDTLSMEELERLTAPSQSQA